MVLNYTPKDFTIQKLMPFGPRYNFIFSSCQSIEIPNLKNTIWNNNYGKIIKFQKLIRRYGIIIMERK